MFCLLSFVMHVVLFSLLICVFGWAPPPPRGTVGCATFPFCVGFRLLSAPPATMVACGRVLTLGSLVFAPVFYFNSPLFVSPPRHADDARDRYDGGWSCHSALFVSPPATPAVRGRFWRMVCLLIVSAFPSITSFAFSWHHSQAV